MIVEQLFIDGKEVDIKDTQIVRKYTTPYFTDVSKVFLDTTQTITLPQTERNKAVMEYLHEADMSTDFPYTIHRADYIVDGMQLIRNGEAKVLGDFEIQIVYGIDREKYLPLKETKLNEIVPNGTTILESDWVVNWDRVNYKNTTAKYKYLDYVKREKTSDVITSGGIVKPPVEPDSPMLENQDVMAHHPFISFENILDLINANHAESVEYELTTSTSTAQNKITFVEKIVDILQIGDILVSLDNNPVGFAALITYFEDDYTAIFNGDISEFYDNGVVAVITGYRDLINFENLKTKIKNKGIILGGRKDNFEYSQTYNYSGFESQNTRLRIAQSYYDGIVTINTHSFSHNIGRGGDYKSTIILDLDFTIIGISGISLYRQWFNPDTGSFVTELVQNISPTRVHIGLNHKEYKKQIQIEFSNTDEKSYDYFIDYDGEISPVSHKFYVGSKIKISYKINDSVFRYVDAFGDSVGRYNCLINLPNITELEFIQQMLILSGQSFGTKFEFKNLEQFKVNYDNGNVYDWSGRISNVKKSYYQFNSNTQKNWIKYQNSDNLIFKAKESINVNDLTLTAEKDLFSLNFNLAEINQNRKAEFILYKQTSTIDDNNIKTWKNEYSEKNSVCVYDLNNIATVEHVLPNSIENSNSYISACNITAANVISISDGYEPDIFIPEIGNRILSANGTAITDCYIIDRTGSTLTLNRNALTVSGLADDFVEFDKSTIGIVENYYSIYQKLVERPIVKEVNVLLDFYESANIDFTKPVYISEWGKYCMLLELTAPNKGLCEAKLLLINQTL